MRSRKLIPVGAGAALCLALSGAAVAMTPDTPDFPAGLARAAQTIGQDIAGRTSFYSTKSTVPDTPDAPQWNVSVEVQPCVRTNVNVFLREPLTGIARTAYRVEIADGVVSMLYDSNAGGAIGPEYQPSADLSGFIPSDGGDIPPDTPDFPAGLARAAQNIGQDIVGVTSFYSTKAIAPDVGDAPQWNVYVAGNPDFRTNLNVFVRDTASGAGRTAYRFEIAGGVVRILQDPSAGGSGRPVSADLSGFVAPDSGDTAPR